MNGKLIVLVCILFFIFSAAQAEEKIEKIEFRDAAVLDVVEAIVARAGLDLVICGDQSAIQAKRITLRLNDISATEAIGHILRTAGLIYERKGKLLLVSTLPQDQSQSGYPDQAEAVSLKHRSAEKIASLIEKIFTEVKVSRGEDSSSVVISGKGPSINEAKALIRSIDLPVSQVLIECKVLEIAESDSMRLGLSFGKDAGVFKFITDKESGDTSPVEELQTTLNTLVGSGKARVVASPRIATLDDHEAVINIGSRIPYAVPVTSGASATQWTVEYIQAGVKLKILPSIQEEGQITALIQPEVSSISEWRTTAAGEFPVITTRNAMATLRVKDGETIAIGGLLSETDRENIIRLPILGYLPVLGLFFQNKTVEKAKTEIVFLITPHIL